MRGDIPVGRTLVLFSDQRAYERYKGGPRWTTTQEMRKWLRKGDWVRWPYYPIDWNLAQIGEVYLFTDPGINLLFKLAWA